MNWNYFISHASEDKRLVAAPLAHYFSSTGFSVWYDDFSLKVGDSILAGINTGLAESAYGIVILSPSFFKKSWPQRELAGLMAQMTGTERRILPVWHEITSAEIIRAAPLLADIKAVSTSRGLNAVAEEIVRASFPERAASMPASNSENEEFSDFAEAQATLRDLLALGVNREDVFLVISAYQILLKQLDSYSPLIVPATRVSSELPFQFAIFTPHGITGPISLTFVLLGPVEDKAETLNILAAFDGACGPEVSFTERPSNDYLRGRKVGEFPTVVNAAEQIKHRVASRNIHYERPELWNCSALVICGRRGEEITPKQGDAIQGISIRIHSETASYDRLVDEGVARPVS